MERADRWVCDWLETWTNRLPDVSTTTYRTPATLSRTISGMRREGATPLRLPLGQTAQPEFTSLELCAGGGGQAIGLEAAGFKHCALVEIDRHACATLRANSRTHDLGWDVVQADLNHFDASAFEGRVDLLAGGLPCPPFSRAGKQLGEDDDRNLWPAALRIIEQTRPRAVMFENVRGILDAVFDDFRNRFSSAPALAEYSTAWKMLNACDFGVPQLRPRVVFVALRKTDAQYWSWPAVSPKEPPTVGEAIGDLIAERGWRGARRWKQRANEIAPTIVGGSLKHGGPDLGPTRARKEWASLGVDGLGLADEAPARDFVGMPRLTVRMVARLQGFPDDWMFEGGKTASYRQVGNAFPPPVAEAVARQIYACLAASDAERRRKAV